MFSWMSWGLKETNETQCGGEETKKNSSFMVYFSPDDLN